MSIVKNVSAPYTIYTINRGDPVTIDADAVLVNGNLTVLGNTFLGNVTNAQVEQTYIADNIISLNAGTTGTPVLNAGIEVNRGNQPNTILYWNESLKQWQVTNDGSTYYNVVATTTGNTRVVDDTSPQLGANLFTNNYAITNITGNIFLDPGTQVTLNGNLSMQMVSNTDPAGYNTITASVPAAGGTGLFVTTGDGTTTNEELISKKRAIVYSIIF
jgi:hypothetical protein